MQETVTVPFSRCVSFICLDELPVPLGVLLPSPTFAPLPGGGTFTLGPPLQRTSVRVFTSEITVVFVPVTVIGPKGTLLCNVTVYWTVPAFLPEPQPAAARRRSASSAAVRSTFTAALRSSYACCAS